MKRPLFTLKDSPSTNYLSGETALSGGAIGGGAAGGAGAVGGAVGAGAVIVIVYASHDIITYRPCQPLGWGNALTWVGDRLADELYGQQPCGCSADPQEDKEKFCALVRQACEDDGDEKLFEGEISIKEHRVWMDQCEDEYVDCLYG